MIHQGLLSLLPWLLNEARTMRSQFLVPFVAAGAVAASSCAPSAVSQGPTPVAPPVVDTIIRVDTVRITTEAAADAELEAQVGLLQIQLLERDVRLREVQEQRDAARQEVVRNLAKLQSQASRAEAASGISEAEIALQALGRVPGGGDLPEFSEAQALIEESSTEFAAENYGGALYLATQARTLARTGQSRHSRAAGESLRAGETLFSAPVPLKTTQRSNVRGGPGLNFAVEMTLDPETPVTGQSYTTQWVRIVDSEGREGWIFHTLVTAGVS